MYLIVFVCFCAAFSSAYSLHASIKRANLHPRKNVMRTASTMTYTPSSSLDTNIPAFRNSMGRSSLIMQQRQGGGGSTKIERKTTQQTSTKPSLKDEIEKDWRLIVHDDTIHTIQQVCEILSRCCPLCSGPRAYEVTLETHMTGAGTVAVANKKIIQEYCKSLQMAGLTVSMAPDDEFESGEGEE